MTQRRRTVDCTTATREKNSELSDINLSLLVCGRGAVENVIETETKRDDVLFQ